MSNKKNFSLIHPFIHNTSTNCLRFAESSGMCKGDKFVKRMMPGIKENSQ